MLLLELEQDQVERFEEIAKKTGKTKDYYITRIKKDINRYLEDLEDLAIAKERSANVRSGKSKVISLRELLEENDL